jgi:transposase
LKYATPVKLTPGRLKQLITIPGVSELSAHVIISEIGTDMSRFATDAHLRSWAGLCPRNDESAGKRRSRRLRHGSHWLKTMLVQCAWASTRSKGSYLQALFLRLRGRCGPKKAICAVAASILTAAYHMLKDGTFGAYHFNRRRPEAQARQLLKRLASLGFSVELKPLATAS